MPGAFQVFTSGSRGNTPGAVIFDGTYQNAGDGANAWFEWGYGNFNNSTAQQAVSGSSGGYSKQITGQPKDTALQFRAQGDGGAGGDGGLTTKTGADTPTAGTPASSAVTNNSATISCTYDAKVVQSDFTVYMEYRKLGDSTWIQAGAGQTNTGTSISRDITGLLGSTIYEFRFRGTRTTLNIGEWTSTTSTFTTQPDAPTITTNAASVITSNSANLNGTVDPNTISCRVRFGWGIADGGSNPNAWNFLTAYQNFSGDGNQTFAQNISGLNPSTTYFFRAFVEWPSPGFANGSSGSTLSFATIADPAVEAAQEDHLLIFEYEAQYGVQDTFDFMLPSPAATSSDRFVTTAPGTLFQAADVKVIKDGGASANSTNAPTQPNASQPLYRIVLTATELTAEKIVIQIVDAVGTAFRDAMIFIRTKQRIGQILVNASQIGGSAPAVSYQPSAGGFSLDLQDSAGTNVGSMRGFVTGLATRTGTAQAGGASSITLDSGASATDNYYNGDIILIVAGTGVGQSRVITAYVGSTKVATVNASWSTNPDSTSRFVIVPGPRTLDLALAELASIPSAGDSAGKKLQFCFQRFAFKIDQTATLQTLYTSAGVSLGTRSVSDDGTTQTIQKVV